MVNTFQMLGRERKAATIAEWLIARGFTAADVRAGLGDDAHWAALAGHLGMKKIASLATREMVVEMVERSEHLWIGEETK